MRARISLRGTWQPSDRFTGSPSERDLLPGSRGLIPPGIPELDFDVGLRVGPAEPGAGAQPAGDDEAPHDRLDLFFSERAVEGADALGERQVVPGGAGRGA